MCFSFVRVCRLVTSLKQHEDEHLIPSSCFDTGVDLVTEINYS